MLWLWLAALAVVPDELAVRADTSRCELSTRVPDALRRALPGVAIADADTVPGAGRVRFVVSIALAERLVSVGLIDQDGVVVLARSVVIARDACIAVADGVAVIV